MPCFYCGKQISLVRRLADADFCSEDHRNKYHDLTRMALTRLVETRDHLAAATPRRKRPRGPVAVEEPRETLPPLADWLEERVAAVPVVAQLTWHAYFDPPAAGMHLPGTPPASLQTGLSAGLPRPYGAPKPVRTLQPRRITSARGGAFLRPAPLRPQWMQGLGRTSAAHTCGFGEQPPARAWEAEAAESVGHARVSCDACLPAGRVLFPSPRFVLPTGRSSCQQLLDIPTKLAFGSTTGALVPAPAAQLLGEGAASLSAPVWAPCPAGLGDAVSPWRVPPPSGLLSMCAAGPWLPARVGAMLLEATTTAPALFEPRLPAMARRCGLPSASALGSGPPLHGPPPVETRLAGAMLVSSSVTTPPLWSYSPVASLGGCIWGAFDLLTLARPRVAVLKADGWSVPPSLTKVELQPRAGWRLATVGFETGQTREAVPPGAREALPLAVPKPRPLPPALAVATHAFSRPAAALPPSETAFVPRKRLPAAAEMSLPAGLSISSAASVPSLAHVLACAPAVAVPGLPVRECGVALRLPRGCRADLEALLPFEVPARAASGAGWAPHQPGWGVSSHPSWAGRLRPLDVDADRVAAPPAVDEPVLVWVPEALGSGASPARGPLPQWRPPAADLPRVDLYLRQQPLGSASLRDMPAPGVRATATGPGPRLAPAPGFPIGRPLYVGWAAMRLRRALDSGGLAELGAGEAYSAPAGLRENPAPGFRVAAWAFTHAPGIPRSAVLSWAPLLPAPGARPADRVRLYARGLDNILARPPASVPLTWIVGLKAGSLTLEAAAAAALAEMTPAAAGSAPRFASVEAYSSFAASRPALPTATAAQALLAPVTWEAAAAADLPELSFLAPAAVPHSFEWARLAVDAGDLGGEAGEAFAPLGHLLSAWQRGMAEVRDLSVRLPRDRKAMEAAAGGRLGAASPVPVATAPQGAVCGPPRTLDWQALTPPRTGSPSVRQGLARVRWVSADLRPAGGPEPPRGAPAGWREASAGVRGPAMRWPRFDGVAARGFLGGASRARAAQLSGRDCAAAHTARIETSVAAGPPLAAALPRGSFTTVMGRLHEATPCTPDGRGEDVRMRLRYPPEPKPGVSALGMPASAGVAACSFDLVWPWTAEVEPVSRNQTHALRNQPRVAPLKPSMALQARPCVPIPHRFEPLPLESGFSLGRLFKRMPGLMLVHLISLVVLVLAGVVLWQTGAAATLRDRVRQRAAISLAEDFAGDMRLWTGGAPGWVRNPAGFVQVGSLALWNPSVRLANYRVEFMGEIERQSLAWVVRARDPGNYYAMRIAVLKPGPLPVMALERFETVDGKAGLRTQAPLRVMLHNNAPFRVQVRISQNEFTTFINGQMVDYWSASRFASGGVGFYSEPGARARLYWVKVTHQDDLVGKLCAYIAPNSVDLNNGS